MFMILAMTHQNTPQPAIAHKSGPLTGVCTVAGDKSISHRALMFGALATPQSGTTEITGLLTGEDVLATAAAMRALGAKITTQPNGTWQVVGAGVGQLHQPPAPLDMGNSGTSARLISGILASHALNATLTGDASLQKRPMGRVTDPLSHMGARFDTAEGGRLPMVVHGTTALKPINYTLPVASAQVKSAILLAALNTHGQTVVIENDPTRDHTENMLRHFGVAVDVQNLPNGGKQITINGPCQLQAANVLVPADPSSAAFLVAAALLVPQSDITITNVGMNPLRTGLFTTLLEMGADIAFENQRVSGGEPVADLRVRYTPQLKGITVPASRAASMIDEYPILSMVATCATGITHCEGIEELRVKESDRAAIVAQGLQACGVQVDETHSSLTIHGQGQAPLGGATIATHLDHRIAMSFLVLGLVSAQPIEVDDASPIATSFPNFLELMARLGANIKLSIEESV